jgi:hypothetical protein
MLLRDLREGGMIERIRAQFQNSGVVLGIGDDAAIVDIPPNHSIVFCSDLVAEDTHFTRQLHPPDAVGYKAVAANVSDVGAMGGVPMHFVISLAAPGDLDLEWVEGFYSGVGSRLSRLRRDSCGRGLILCQIHFRGRGDDRTRQNRRCGEALRREGGRWNLRNREAWWIRPGTEAFARRSSGRFLR